LESKAPAGWLLGVSEWIFGALQSSPPATRPVSLIVSDYALVGDYRRQDHGEPPAAGGRAPWYTLNYRFVMQTGDAILPKPPVK
jgi:hypothetical protein